MLLFLISTLSDSYVHLDACYCGTHLTLAVASVPPVYVTSQLDEGIMCVFCTGKARLL
jgi:hypothetical protein